MAQFKAVLKRKSDPFEDEPQYREWIIELKSETLEDSKAELFTVIKELLQYETALTSAEIIEVSNSFKVDIESTYKAVAENIAMEMEEEKLKNEKLEYERLKQKFGSQK